MHDPLRERSLPGKRKDAADAPVGSMLHRTTRWVASGPGVTGQPASTPQAVVVRFHRQQRVPAPQIGHNGGPLLEPNDPNEGWRRYCWRRAHKAAWKTPPREIALRRLHRAEVLGMTYREYTLEILERGRYL